MFLLVLNIVFFIAFTGFAWVNLNDNDAWKWIPIYMTAAILCGLAALGYYFPMVYMVVVSIYALYAVVLFFTRDGVWDWLTKYKRAHIAQTMQATRPYIEKTREFFGLLIISMALVLNLLVSTNS